jgi:hypothetical protein
MKRSTPEVRGRPLSLSQRDAIRALILERGERNVQELLGLAQQTVARALAGLPLAEGTHAILRERLWATTTEAGASR